ncbi:hTAFII28-like protein conserved region-domain-containing protein [Amylostereum chailletii]|nr:hTAFII28-like protein conserved region-domain-containing protein [Amylostereum chailletii]
MTTPYPTYTAPQQQQRASISFNPGPSTPTPRGRGRGGTGAKRGRKPKGSVPAGPTEIPHTPVQDSGPSTSQVTPLQWSTLASTSTATTASQIADVLTQTGGATAAGSSAATGVVLPAGSVPPTGAKPAGAAAEEEGEGDDEVLPAMADDDYSAQLSWQSQSKDNLKVLMDNFTPEQYERFEAYRRHALPKQAVRKVVHQTLGQQVSQPVAQVVAGFAKVFVGEIVEKARAVQTRRGETGPLSPYHLREAYHMYQLETGRVGAARPLKSKRLFQR